MKTPAQLRYQKHPAQQARVIDNSRRPLRDQVARQVELRKRSERPRSSKAAAPHTLAGHLLSVSADGKEMETTPERTRAFVERLAGEDGRVQPQTGRLVTAIVRGGRTGAPDNDAFLDQLTGEGGRPDSRRSAAPSRVRPRAWRCFSICTPGWGSPAGRCRPG
jgi:hypothetical protein